MRKNQLKIIVFAFGLVFLASVVDAKADCILTSKGLSGCGNNEILVGGGLDPAGLPDLQSCEKQGLVTIGSDPYFKAVCSVAATHKKCEQKLYGCQQQHADLAGIIHRYDTNFIPFLTNAQNNAQYRLDDLERSQCVAPSFEFYDNSRVCNLEPSHIACEVRHKNCATSNLQLWDKIQKDTQQKEMPCNDLAWGGDTDNQARYKPVSESSGKVVVLLPNEYCSDVFGAQGAFGQTFYPLIANMRIEDALGGVIDSGSLRHCGEHNNGRLHWNFGSASSFGFGPIFVRYDVVGGGEECRRVADPFSDLGR